MPDPAAGRIRPSAKAVVLQGGRLLVTRNRSERDPGGEWLLLPGGGQRAGETLVQALGREVAEETGLTVAAGRLLWMREYISDHHEFADLEPGKHHIEFMFECRVVGPTGEPSCADDHQTGWAWMDLDEVAAGRLFPNALVDLLRRWAAGHDSGPVYLGDVN